MYQFLNIHPKGKLVRDCVKRAITKATDMDYHTVSLELNRLKKETDCSAFNDRKNITAYMQKHGYIKLSFPAVRGEPRMSGEGFCQEYSKGRYILNMAGHLTCCIDGIIYDTWDCSQKCVYNAWKIK